MVVRNVRNAAEAIDQKFAVTQDIAGCNNDVMERLKTDWMSLVDVKSVTESSNYILQNGLLVLHIWGIGFEHIDVTDAFGMNSLIKWLQSDAHLPDGIHNVGVFDNANKFDSYFKNTIANDAVYCKRIGILYLPTMFPGFSWYNLKNGASAINKIPRNGGDLCGGRRIDIRSQY